ncbi:hypothetical protein GC105_00265 [Alkalibaculum sp. M08DMB]|uniref:Uncharacterized protein n=1 Tax=Alkalibaculum sporogenes TaxID=2655001 RepID=A0A6A7K4C7_9FIRM|nr:hypothetical protein [Alkalibaculum sporogenes]MPW24230.1 hypothetical protein [Alkalibaculum sporogenes]
MFWLEQFVQQVKGSYITDEIRFDYLVFNKETIGTCINVYVKKYLNNDCDIVLRTSILIMKSKLIRNKEQVSIIEISH